MTTIVRGAEIRTNSSALNSYSVRDTFFGVKVVITPEEIEGSRIKTILEFIKEGTDEVLLRFPMMHQHGHVITEENWIEHLSYLARMERFYNRHNAGELQISTLDDLGKPHHKPVNAVITWHGAFGKKHYISQFRREDDVRFIFSLEDHQYTSMPFRLNGTVFNRSDIKGDTLRPVISVLPEKIVVKLPLQGSSSGGGKERIYTGYFKEPLSEERCANIMLEKRRLENISINALRTADSYTGKSIQHALMPATMGEFKYAFAGDGSFLMTLDPDGKIALANVASQIALVAAVEKDGDTVKAYSQMMDTLTHIGTYRNHLDVLWQFIQSHQYLGMVTNVEPLQFDTGEFKAKREAERAEQRSLTSAYYKMRRGSAPDQYTTEELIALRNAGFDLTSDPFRFGEDQLKVMRVEVDPSDLSSE